MTKRGRNRTGVGLRSGLVVSYGTLVVVVVGTLAMLAYFASRSLFERLGSEVIEAGMNGAERALREELDAAVDQANYIASAVAQGRYDLERPARLSDFLAGSLAAAPQIDGVMLVDASGSGIRVERGEPGGAPAIDSVDASADPDLRQIAERARTGSGPFWTRPAYRPERRSTVLGLCVPIRDRGKHFGFVLVGVFSDDLSAFAEKLSDRPHLTVFMLFGRDQVLAHPGLKHGALGLSRGKPLLGLDEIGDPVLAELARARPLREADRRLSGDSRALIVTKGGQRRGIFLRALHGYGNKPLIVGAYSELSLLDAIERTVRSMGLVVVALLLGAIALALLISRVIARPIDRAADRASQIRGLDFDSVATLPGSRIREVDELATSFNAMLAALKSFGRYVPRRLVAKLIKESRVGAGSEERALSVMFTDIAGFSAACEAMSAKEVADFMNHHLTLVSTCIEREGGTIDKYIGDAVMAFWGAPDRIENTALPACRAAVAIRAAIGEDNRRRAREGLPAVRIRIGIHTGTLVVGDIGGPSRINYTVVGDVVNAAQRLESLGKDVAPEAETVVLISRATAELLTDEFDAVAQGRFKVKGREQEIEVFALG